MTHLEQQLFVSLISNDLPGSVKKGLKGSRVHPTAAESSKRWVLSQAEMARTIAEIIEGKPDSVGSAAETAGLVQKQEVDRTSAPNGKEGSPVSPSAKVVRVAAPPSLDFSMSKKESKDEPADTGASKPSEG